MKKKAASTSIDAGKQTEDLQARIAEALNGSEKNDKEIQELREKITGIQRRCPHNRIKKGFTTDGVGIKLCRFCLDCGARF